MCAGLDELIESLLTEIAFSGVRGCLVSSLLVAIDAIYKPDDTDDVPHGAASGHDLAVASKIWRWLADRSDVSIGIDRASNHLSLEQVLALPEEQDAAPLVAAVGSSRQPPKSDQTAPDPTSSLGKLKSETSAVRPRLHVSEERQWRTIAGHGPDLKRVPLFEWRALVDIASVKEKGILQGDLVRLTGQDKRSLPTRTDALARKGYIIKQPIVLRGGKSSKLWLAQFADSAREDREREGLDYDSLDLSVAALTIDLNPVPFCHKWNGETIDYLALAQGFVEIAKAWKLIRYCDARAKLGVEERVRQMRALAKTCRWLTNIGALTFVGAKFAGSSRLFKDCVKFLRDPTPGEWTHFRATPKTRMVVPSGRIGKRGEASRAAYASQPDGTKSKATGKKSRHTKPRRYPAFNASVIPPPWKPQKPVPNTAFEIIKRTGSEGTSNAAICQKTLGYNFRRLTAAMTGSISMPTNSQPAHLKHLSSTSQLSRIGKTMTYTFYANSEIPQNGPNEEQAQMPSIADGSGTSTSAANAVSTFHKDSAFSQLDMSRFATDPGLALTNIAKLQGSSRASLGMSKRKRPIVDEADDQPSVKKPKRSERPPTNRSADNIPSEPVEEHKSPEEVSEPSDAQQINTDQQEPPRAPGAYRGIPNSLDPVTKRKGRRPKSLVIIFKSDKLKDPAFLGASAAPAKAEGLDISSQPELTTTATPTTHVEAVNLEDDSHATATASKITSENLSAKPRGSKSRKNGPFTCEKCGNTWKNSNGLDYHITKSRTSCNPSFVPPTSEVINHRRRKPAQPRVLERSSGRQTASEEQRQSRQTLTPKEQMESRLGRKRPLLATSQQPSSPITSEDEDEADTPKIGDTTDSQSLRGGIILQDLTIHNAINHQRPLNQRKPSISKDAHDDKSPPATNRQPHTTGHRVPSNDIATAEDVQTSRHGIRHSNRRANNNIHMSRTGTDQARFVAKDQSSPTNGSFAVDSASVSRDSLPISPSSERSSVRKPLPSIPRNQSVESTPPITAPTPNPYPTHVLGPANDDNSDFSPQPESPSNHALGQQSTYKPLSFFARQTRPKASFGARRRDRTMQIIEYLLERNDGVFPGLRSLFMAIISVWAKEFNDLAPPDRRICQNTVNQMERDGLLKQMHFFFFDDQAKMQECVVLAKSDSNTGPGVDSSDDPRVIAVKEKMREMFPEAYVPDAFSLSPDEAKLFDELAPQGKEHHQTRNIKVPKDQKKVQDIETLQYENSVMGDIALHRVTTAKRQADEAAQVQPPPKKIRIDAEHSDSLERTRKPRKRPDKHELWDSGKVAVYIWSQRRKPSAMWDQPRSCLQDPTTGAWSLSWSSDPDPSQMGSINTILSSIKSAKYIDASIQQRGRKRRAGAHRPGLKKIKRRHGGQNNENDQDALMAGGYGHDSPNGSTFRPPASVLFEVNSSVSDEESRGTDDYSRGFSDYGSADSSTLRLRFGNSTKGPRLHSQQPPSRDNPPRDVYDILRTARYSRSTRKWADPMYGEFTQNLETIKKWELSAKGADFFAHGAISSDYVYISLPVVEVRTSLKPLNLEWLSSNQFTIDNIPDEVKNTSYEDENYGIIHLIAESRKTKRKYKRTTGVKRSSQKAPMSRSSRSLMQQEGFIEYKTRDLTAIPKQPRGRFNKPAAHDDKLGSKREDELVAACVVFRTLLGGLDRNIDMGLLLKHFPGMSLSAIKKFWPRICRERKSYVQALTEKFQSAFLEAYESGEVQPLNYDDIQSYDWEKLILWTTQLETHEDIDLPGSRDALHQNNLVEDVANEEIDWREIWFSTTSTYNRIEAVASETMSIPLPPKDQPDRAILERARTWVRSICCTPLKGVNVKERLVPKLLELGDGDVSETNRILEKAVEELNRAKVITRTKGKDLGGNFRIHGMFSKPLEKLACTPKLRQAIAFKAQLDEVFRRGEEFMMPYASDDGSVMAVLNLQAHGRIHIETVDMPNIPFGFEPGNYEGRTFPKSYYHFKVRLTPTETYLFNEDLALLDQAQLMEPPTQGPGEKIPIWIDFFNNLNTERWADYVSMVVFTLATKGPIVPAMCVTLLKPMFEEFEVQLVIEWLEKLGLIQQAVHGCGVTVAEWWWLLAGHIVQLSDKATGEKIGVS
ncbi:hypothetical protein F4777DRAFT_576027 [Nemania sp. FL0916]|nr:hypothetical protein F4777DRAFT_576027 [Nemania sp. FL0916]